MLHHVSIELDPHQVPRARVFWRIIGFREVTPPEPLRGSTVWLEAPALSGSATVQVHLMLVSEPADPGTGHAAFVVPELGQVVDRLESDGFEVLERKPYWGARRVFAIHPGGSRVELMEGAP